MNISWTQLGAAAGTILGIVNGWVLLRDRQQRVTIDRINGNDTLEFRITNRTHRPIPLHSVVLRFHEEMPDLTWRNVDYNPETGDLKLPGILPPEASVPLRWSTRDIVTFIMYKKVKIVVKTQTGKQIKKTFRRANTQGRWTLSQTAAQARLLVQRHLRRWQKRGAR